MRVVGVNRVAGHQQQHQPFSFGGYPAYRTRPRSRPPSIQRGYHAPRPPRGTQFPAHLQGFGSPKRRTRSQPAPNKSPQRTWPHRPGQRYERQGLYNVDREKMPPVWNGTMSKFDLFAEGQPPPIHAPPTAAAPAVSADLPERPSTPELKQLGMAFLDLQKEEMQLAQLRSQWQEEDKRAKEALARVELAAQRVAMSRAQLPEATQATAEEATRTSPARPAWLAKKPAWLDKQTGTRLRNGQLGQPVSGGWVAIQHADGTFGFAPNPAAATVGQDSPQPKQPWGRPATATTSASSLGRSRTATRSVASSGSKGRPFSAPGGARMQKAWSVTDAALKLDERLNRMDDTQSAPTEQGARVVAGRIFVDGVPANPGMNSVVNA